jgi:hypothetical protein
MDHNARRDTLTGAQRALYGRIGAAVARSRHDPRDLTANGRSAFLARFEREAREQFPGLPESEIQRRGGELLRAHMLGLAAKSSVTRSQRRTPAPEKKASVQEVDDVHGITTTASRS